jgi:hypothetical protein
VEAGWPHAHCKNNSYKNNNDNINNNNKSNNNGPKQNKDLFWVLTFGGVFFVFFRVLVVV